MKAGTNAGIKTSFSRIRTGLETGRFKATLPSSIVVVCDLVGQFGMDFSLWNLIGWEVFWLADFIAEGLLLKLEEMTRGKTDLSAIHLPSSWIMFLIIGLAGSVDGATVNLPVTLCEEIGWRGFIFIQLENQSWMKRSLITVIIWGLWHTQLILMEHNSPDHPYLGVLMLVFF